MNGDPLIIRALSNIDESLREHRRESREDRDRLHERIDKLTDKVDNRINGLFAEKADWQDCVAIKEECRDRSIALEAACKQAGVDTSKIDKGNWKAFVFSRDGLLLVAIIAIVVLAIPRVIADVTTALGPKQEEKK